ncbi:MAG: cob(I)yrinic acid a,c-diamide adenosyltransferase [Desulfosarcinaceae bacterium]|jgi:cob(I)alamin adenosyltransferase
MKIYTRTGDKGKSSLLSGERVPKNNVRVKAYGEVDELNSVIGALAAALPETLQAVPGQLQRIQRELFNVGAYLATTPGTVLAEKLPPVGQEQVHRLESDIDALQGGLPELKSFILPGGHIAAGWAHLARTVCRRAERSAIDLADTCAACEDHIAALAPVLAYLNRLSDYLFVVARACNQAAGVDDVIWRPV